MTAPLFPNPDPNKRPRVGFVEDFRRFFVRGLAAVLPTMVTIWLLLWAWDFLWENIGRQIIIFIRQAWFAAGNRGWIPFQTPQYIISHLDESSFGTRALGVVLSIVFIYIVGVFVGNLIGRTAWALAERGLLRIPLVRAIYPAVKQITDFVLTDHSRQFHGSRVVAVQPHEQNIWSIGLVTGAAPWRLAEADPEEMVTVFVPSTPTSFSGYVLVVPRKRVVELPMTVEEAFRLLVSGGVIAPGAEKLLGHEMGPPQNPAHDAVARAR